MAVRRLRQCVWGAILAIPSYADAQTARPEWTLDAAYEVALAEIYNAVSPSVLGAFFPREHVRLEISYGGVIGPPEWGIAVDMSSPAGWTAEIARFEPADMAIYANAILASPDTPVEKIRASLPIEYAVANARICPRADELLQKLPEQDWSLADSYAERFTPVEGGYLSALDGSSVHMTIKHFDVALSISGPAHSAYVTGWAMQLSQELEECERVAPARN